jgi:ATP-dependent Clp protease ATP-binding subunit ClpA
MENLTKKYANGNSPNIKGRDREVKQLLRILLRQEKPNAMMLGESGVGKTSIIHHLAYLIANNLVPDDLKGFHVIEVNTNSLLSGDGYRGVTEKKFEDLITKSLANGKVILFIDEFHTAENLGKMSNNSTPGLGNTLKPYLTRGDFRVIGATTTEEYKTLSDKALLRRFTKIFLTEPDEDTIKSIIKKCFSLYIGNSKITIEKDVPEKVYQLSLVIEDGNNPDKAKDIVDMLVADAKLTNTKKINTDYVESVFNEIYLLNAPKKQEAEDIFAS